MASSKDSMEGTSQMSLETEQRKGKGKEVETSIEIDEEYIVSFTRFYSFLWFL